MVIQMVVLLVVGVEHPEAVGMYPEEGHHDQVERGNKTQGEVPAVGRRPLEKGNKIQGGVVEYIGLVGEHRHLP